MTSARPTIVCITTHAVLRAMFERHGERFARIQCFGDIAEFERRAIQLRPAAIVLDESGFAHIEDDVRRIRKHPSLKAVRILVLCSSLSHETRAALHEARVDDILLATHYTPRDIMARLQTLL